MPAIAEIEAVATNHLAEQQEELLALEAIYPDRFNYRYHIDRNIGTAHVFVVAEDGEWWNIVTRNADRKGKEPELGEATGEMVLQVRHMPPVRIDFTLPPGYPYSTPPTVRLECEWIDDDALRATEALLRDAWAKERDMILFSWLDMLADIRSFAQLTDPLIVSNEIAWSIRSFDQMVREADFARTLYPCPVCMEEVRGSDCLRLACGHAFCAGCLTGYFSLMIQEGRLASLQCPSIECQPEPHKPDEPELRYLLGDALADRYAQLQTQRSLEADPTIVWCPRPTCQGPAHCDATVGDPNRRNGAMLAVCNQCYYSFCTGCNRGWHGPVSKCRLPDDAGIQVDLADEYASGYQEERRKLEQQYGRHTIRKLVRAQLGDDAISDADDGCDDDDPRKPRKTATDNAVQENETAASSARPRRIGRIAARRETRKWIHENTKRCPQCRSQIQKWHGCNRMQCFVCKGHFCWLCLKLLPITDPYSHYRSQGESKCAGLLFLGVDET
ncbi:hypothetical protein THASP1DRAFT_29294 [Thamnocephalis sphaerospora]|uniref:RBR-type E3 ubiquitin transferase n=1 Tax=Thamnocephalis sphaerospora TaxID=78915 RepID=A0A4P9XS27_9FUNG|nr:hypothetical protein THASP1DRAFT_29294 [Thamnocephalis sphaerospora]|eukprot:RKP08906.1 hypothetical protein THASP1DRAFT_29294 [Thamnocephalis sphaerospora]